MNLKEQRAAAVQAAKDIMAGAKAAEREITDEEKGLVEGHLAKAREIDAQLLKAADSADLLKQLGEIGNEQEQAPAESVSAKSMGEHFVKSSAFEQMKAAKGARFTASSTEFKAAGDPALVGALGQTQYGQVVPAQLRRLTISDLLSQGTLAGSSLTYWTQGTVTGDFTSVAEGGTKPSINFAFSQVVESLSKLAGVTKISDEMQEDAPYLTSVINSQLLLRLGIVEEAQLLNGDGTSPNLRGILNRTGVQTESAANNTDNLDAIFRALTKVQTGSQLSADGVVMHPTDYQAMRLSQDANKQYYGGGPFSGAYGNGGIQMQPGVWGMNTVVTTAITAGTVLVGAFAAAGQVFRKGGVRIESTNSNEADFTKNLIAIRAEERLALAVYIPTAFVKVTLSNTAPV